MLIDTHSHLNFAAFGRDREKVIKNCLGENVSMINIGTNFFTSQKAVEIAQDYEGVYASTGLHPINLEINLEQNKAFKKENYKLESKGLENFLEKYFDYEKYKKLAQNKKVVAIGEIGLDYYLMPKDKAMQEIFKHKQKQLFLEELRLSKELDLPIILHCRMAHDELLQILKQESILYNELFRGVIHCFTGKTRHLKQYLDLGFLIGINGIIFKMNLKEQIKKIPLEKILIETDCPYLLPPISTNQRPPASALSASGWRAGKNQGKSAVERNDPMGVKFVAQEIAKIKEISLEQVSKETTKNAKELFRI